MNNTTLASPSPPITLRWITQLGTEPLTEEQRTEILEERERAEGEFRLKRADLEKEVEFGRVETTCTASR